MRAGTRVELCYAAGTAGAGGAAGAALVANAAQLIRASRGRGVVLSSGAARAAGLRGPWDAANLATVWGLKAERGVEAVGTEARFVVAAARVRREGWRGVVGVVEGGGGKRKAVQGEGEGGPAARLSKRARKRARGKGGEGVGAEAGEK